MTLKTWYDADIERGLGGERVAVLGYGAQGRAQALNLRDSGVDVVVGLREGSGSRDKARADGFTVRALDHAVQEADLIVLLAPDEVHGTLYDDAIADNAREHAALVFAHGFSVHYGLFEPRGDLDVILVAPKGVGFQLRGTYEAGLGVPGLIGVHRDASGRARSRALAYASALGCGRVGIMETSFRDETETDLFGEQTVLCGGVPALVRGAFDTLTEAGYAPELAYFECLHELKLICDLVYRNGIAGMSEAISNTADYGGMKSGQRIVDEGTRERMKEVLAAIQSGEFAREFMAETRAGLPRLEAAHQTAREHPVENVGAELREMMWGGHHRG